MAKTQDGDVTDENSYTDGTQVRQSFSGVSNFPNASNYPEGVVIVDRGEGEFYQNRGDAWYPIDRNYFGTGEDGVWDGEDIDPATETQYEAVTVEAGETFSFDQNYNGVAVVRVQEDLIVEGSVNVSGQGALGGEGGDGDGNNVESGENGENLFYDGSQISGSRGQGGGQDSYQGGGDAGNPVSNPETPDNSIPNEDFDLIAPGAGGGGGESSNTVNTGDPDFERTQYGGAGGGGGASRNNSGTFGDDASKVYDYYGNSDFDDGGDGGNGGGAVMFIVGGDIILNGSLNCSGQDSQDTEFGGGGGGGGAGMMWLLHRGSLTDNASKNTSGGEGQSGGYQTSGDGGDGGDGSIIIESV